MVHSAVSKGTLFLVVCSTVLLSASSAVLAQPHPREVQAAGAWEVVPISETVSLYALDMISATDGWAGGTSGLALHYDGISWTDADTTFSDVFTAMDMVDAGFGFGTSYQGNILRYSGGQWSTVGQLATSSLTGISMIDANNGWAVGYLGGIYRYQNGSWWEWTKLPYLFQAIDMVSANEGWILGRTGVMLRWDGSTWQVVSTPQNLWFLDVDMVNSSDGWAVGYEGIIYRYDGSAWSPVSSPVPGTTLWSVSMSSSSNGWAVGAGGTILRYDGSSWKIVDSPVTTELHAVDAVSDNEAWAVGKGGAILHYLGTFDLASSSLAASTTHCSAGEAVGYTIRVRNTGSLSASQVVVTDPLPANTSYVAGSAQTTKGTIQGTDPLVVAVGDVGPGGEVTISFQVTAGDPGLACWFMSNQATITAAGAEPIVRQAVTSVGSCLRIHLPLVVRGAGVR